MPTVHPDRYTLSGVNRRKAGVIIHTSESGDGSYPALVAAFARPGDRPLGTTGRMYGSAYHAVTMNADNLYDRILGPEAGPYAAPPLNKTHSHICMPARVAQGRSEWLDGPSLAGIRAVARFIVDESQAHGFPLRRLTSAELKAGAEGYCDHWTVSTAFGKTDHTDVGRQFPWDVLEAEIAALSSTTTPPPPPAPPAPRPSIIPGESTMFTQLVTFRGATFAAYSAGYKTWIPTVEALQMFRSLRSLGGQGTPETVLDNTPQSVAVMQATGPVLGPIPAGRDGWGI